MLSPRSQFCRMPSHERIIGYSALSRPVLGIAATMMNTSGADFLANECKVGRV
jgi:hypothetical protein